MPVERTANPRPVLRTTRLLTRTELSPASDVIGDFILCGCVLLFIHFFLLSKAPLDPILVLPTDPTSLGKLLRPENRDVFSPFLFVQEPSPLFCQSSRPRVRMNR